MDFRLAGNCFKFKIISDPLLLDGERFEDRLRSAAARRALPRDPDEEGRSRAHEITVFERNRADDTFGFGVVFSDATLEQLRATPIPRRYAAITAAASRTGTTSTSTTAARSLTLDRPRLLRPVARRRCSTSSRTRARELGVELALRDARSPTLDALARRRPGRRAPTASNSARPRALRRRTSSRRSTGARTGSCWLGTTLPFAAFTFYLQGERARAVPGPRLPLRRATRRRSSSSAREETWRRGRPRRAPTRTRPSRFCEQLFARRARRPPAAQEPLALAQLPHRPQRALAPRQRRAARRRRAHRALLDRLGHQARDGGRDRARASALARAPRRAGARSPPTRPSAGPRSRRCSARRRRASSGSRRPSATSAGSSRCSSPSAC